MGCRGGVGGDGSRVTSRCREHGPFADGFSPFIAATTFMPHTVPAILRGR